jgi:hypothetical protein
VKEREARERLARAIGRLRAVAPADGVDRRFERRDRRRDVEGRLQCRGVDRVSGVIPCIFRMICFPVSDCYLSIVLAAYEPL